jgi:hypothetical protein
MSIQSISVEVDQYSYDAGPAPCDPKASAQAEAQAVMEYFVEEYPATEISVEIVSNGHGSRVVSAQTDEGSDYAAEQDLQAELDSFIADANKGGLAWMVTTE